jgi:hypothetical protein
MINPANTTPTAWAALGTATRGDQQLFECDMEQRTVEYREVVGREGASARGIAGTKLLDEVRHGLGRSDGVGLERLIT